MARTVRGHWSRADPEAIEALYRSQHREFLRTATAIAGSREGGEDAVQEGLARALAARRSFGARGSLEAWLWKVIVNAARNVRRASRPPTDAAITGASVPESSHDPRTERIRAALEALPERQRLVVFLRYYADLDYATIAHALDIRRGTVSATLSQAQTALRRTLEEGSPR